MSKNLSIKIQVNCIDLFAYSSKIALQTLKVAVNVDVADFERKIAIFICQNLSLCVGLLTFLTKNWNVTSEFRSLLDLVFTVLVFAAFCWNVTPANTEGRLYLVFFKQSFWEWGYQPIYFNHGFIFGSTFPELKEAHHFSLRLVINSIKLKDSLILECL